MKLLRSNFMVDGVVVPEETPDAIYGLFGKYRCLSNFHEFGFWHDGLHYHTSEAAYMAMKTEDLEIRHFFSTLKTGKEAKQFGREIQLRDDWDDYRLHAMYQVLLSKFTQDLNSAEVLLSTGNKYIEETNWWKDVYWGKCGGIGKNHLGQILMSIRDFLRSLDHV